MTPPGASIWHFIWWLSEESHIGLGPLAPFVFGRMINRNGKKVGQSTFKRRHIVNENENGNFGVWGILELMGHVKVAGYVTEEELFGTKMGRIDIPSDNGASVTQYFGGGSVYRMTPVTEDIARAYARVNKPRPVEVWGLALPAQRTETDDTDWEGDGWNDE
ncbi:MAG: hypothetical protein IAE79_07295 [Anaerolinea sp.]|nr:hypothetical protein [Anaerolinea sp.]